MENNYVTIINNKRIYEYYKKNTGINIETMNLILLDFIEQLSTDMTALLQNTFQGQIMSEVKDMKQQITSLQESLFTKIIKTNDEFIEKTKLVISVSTNDNKEHISYLLNKNTDTFIERLNLIIPKGNDDINKKIQEQLSFVHKSLQVDIQQYLTKNDAPLNEFISSFDSKLSTIQQPLFSFITNQGQIITDVKDIKHSVSILQDSINNTLQENNRNFLDTTKLVISSINHENTEKITSLLNNNTENYIERIRTSLPIMHEELSKKIQDHLNMSQKTIQCDLQQYLLTHSETNLQDFLSSFDSKLSLIQQPLFNLIHSNQEHITTKIGSVKEDMVLSKSTSEKLYSEMSEYLNKYKVSSQFKGACSEKDLERLLIDMFPEDEIINTTGETASGDFILRRNNNDYIMFETKSYQTNVDTKETDKFMRDVSNKKLHSIMMSQYTGIVGKKPYTIEINEYGCILIYLHHVNFSQDKIKQAVQIIDNMSPKIKKITEEEIENGIIIDKDILTRINSEFIVFLEKKEKLKEFLKEQHKSACIQIDSLDMPDLSKFLDDKSGISKKMKMYCHCGFGCDNPKQLSNHKRSKHANEQKKEEKVNTVVNMKEMVDEVLPQINEYNNMNMAQLKEECKKRQLNISKKKRDEIIQLLTSNY
jgi:hypothetical protein